MSKKPKALCIKDSWSNKHESAWIYAEIYKGDSGPCVRVDFQGDIETKDVWLDAKSAERLGKQFIKYSQYLKSKPDK